MCCRRGRAGYVRFTQKVCACRPHVAPVWFPLPTAAYLERGNVRLAQKQYEAAVGDYDIALKLQPNLVQVRPCAQHGVVGKNARPVQNPGAYAAPQWRAHVAVRSAPGLHGGRSQPPGPLRMLTRVHAFKHVYACTHAHACMHAGADDALQRPAGDEAAPGGACRHQSC